MELTELILKIEKHYGFPVDVEWAYEKGKFYIVQSRPITTLTDNEKIESKDKLIFEKTITRDWPLFIVEMLHQGFTDEFKRQFGFGYSDVLFDCYSDHLDIYRAPKEHVEKIRSFVLEQLEKNKKFVTNCSHKLLKFYENLSKIPGVDKEKLKQELRTNVPFMPPEEVEPVSFLKERLRETEKRMNYGQETAIAGRKNAARIQDEIIHTKSIEEYGLEKSAETLARAGLYAMEKEKQIQRLEGEKEKPLFIAPENIFPENGYASHPQELKELILKSREQLKKNLWMNGNPTDKARELEIYSEKDAERAANEHIKATFDIGHLNTWRKYFRGDEKEFHQWIKNKVDDLNKAKIIGHIHLSDNFGYYDEHVDPGEGNVPIPQFIKQMQESGYKGKMIIEPAHQDVRAWTKFMSNFASPVYRTKLWTEDDMGFFKGRSYSPTYIVGGYAPESGGEETDWRLWSGIRLE